MHYLARGDWSWLEYLNLNTNCLDAHGVMILTEASEQWPDLNSLCLDASLGSALTFDVLSLDPDFLLGLDARFNQTGTVSVPRCNADLLTPEELSKRSWHELREVDFGNYRTTCTSDGTRITHAYDRKESI